MYRGRSNDRSTSSLCAHRIKVYGVAITRSRRRLAFYREFRTYRLLRTGFAIQATKRCNPYNNEWPCRRGKSFPPNPASQAPRRNSLQSVSELPPRRGDEERMSVFFMSFNLYSVARLYSSSVTSPSHSTWFRLASGVIPICVKRLSGAAPCQ